MAWFAAHAVMCLKCLDGKQEHFPVWENVLLIEAEDDDQAWSKANERGKEDETEGGTVMNRDGRTVPRQTLDGRPARWEFAGIRKLIKVRHKGLEDDLRSGDEITFSEFVLASEAEVRYLADGKEVGLRYIDL
jgi:hypothetical protein